MLIDTHSHIYLEQFNDDRIEVVNRSISAGVEKILLPNIDQTSIDPMMNLVKQFPENCFAMMGLHPSSVSKNWESEMSVVEQWLSKEKYIAIGEIGIDLYWDTTFAEQQKEAFAHQIQLAYKHGLPFIIHSRSSFPEVFEVLEKKSSGQYNGVFHAFSGNEKQGKRAIEMGFKLGIGGVVTYKNAGLNKTIKKLGIDHLVLETDSPYLTPSPHRGIRNESSYIAIIADYIADYLAVSRDEVERTSTQNAIAVFGELE